jgi:hypothetical protein
MLIPRPSSGEASANGGATERETDDTLWAAVAHTVADHFAVNEHWLNKGQERDKRPTRMSFEF